MDQKNVENICRTIKWCAGTASVCYLGKQLIEHDFNFSLRHKDTDFSASPSSKDRDVNKDK